MVCINLHINIYPDDWVELKHFHYVNYILRKFNIPMSVSKLWHYRIVDWSVAMMTRKQHLSGRPRNNPNRQFQIVQKRRLILPWRISFSVGSFSVAKLKCLTMLQKPFQSCSNWRKDCITFDLQKAAPVSNPAELHMRLSFSRSKRKKE